MTLINFFLSYLYLIIINIRNWLYNNKILKSYSFSTPIISLGNITIGGNGKTPMTIYLAKILLNKGLSIGIISRGYKKKKKGTIIVSDGNNILCKTVLCGDEAYLMAKNLTQSFIIVDENKTRAINIMIKKYNPDIILLDDAFQHRKVNRLIDIVVVNSKIPSTNYKMLPKGLLREPAININRSHIIITTYGNNLNKHIKVINNISVFNSKMKYFIKKSVNSKLVNCTAPETVLAFCGIAHPFIFFQQLKKLNIKTHKEITFIDHVRYTKTTIKNLSNIIKDNSIQSIITTEKDYVKYPKNSLINFIYMYYVWKFI